MENNLFSSEDEADETIISPDNPDDGTVVQCLLDALKNSIRFRYCANDCIGYTEGKFSYLTNRMDFFYSIY